MKNDLKRCPRCKTTQEKYNFGVCISQSDGLDPYCRPCRRDYEKSFYKRDRRLMLYKNAKARARRDDIIFSISIDDIKIPERCPILDIPLINGDGKIHANSPCLDRTIPSLGYTPKNIAVISNRANVLKSNGSLDELVAMGKYAQNIVAAGMTQLGGGERRDLLVDGAVVNAPCETGIGQPIYVS